MYTIRFPTYAKQQEQNANGVFCMRFRANLYSTMELNLDTHAWSYNMCKEQRLSEGVAGTESSKSDVQWVGTLESLVSKSLNSNSGCLGFVKH